MMLCVASQKPIGKVSAPSQKAKTWKFAAKFLWKNTFVQNKSELGFRKNHATNRSAT